jgi:hypothetical protein
MSPEGFLGLMGGFRVGAELLVEFLAAVFVAAFFLGPLQFAKLPFVRFAHR